MASDQPKKASAQDNAPVEITPELINRLQSAMRGETPPDEKSNTCPDKGAVSGRFNDAEARVTARSALRRYLIRSDDHVTISIDKKAQSTMHNVFNTFGCVKDFDAWLNRSDKSENDRAHFISAAQGLMGGTFNDTLKFNDDLYVAKLTYLLQNGAIPTQDHAVRVLYASECSPEEAQGLIDAVFIKNGLWMDFGNIDEARIHDALSPVFSTWRKYQDMVENPTPMTAEFGQDIKTVEDVEDSEKMRSNMKGRYAQYFIEGDDIYWQAARNLEFTKLLDLYIAEKKPFPHKALTNDKNDLKLAHLLAFAGEEGVWQKLMNPVLWGTNRDAMVEFYTEYMPETAKQGFDFDKALKTYDQYVARRHIKRPNLS